MAYNKTPFKMKGKSPFMKALVGKQNNLPDALKEKILAAPAKQVEQDSAGSPVAQKAGYVKHKTLTVKGKPLEYNPKFDPKKLITDQSEARDRKSLKKKSPVKQDVTVGDLPDMAVQGAKKLVKKIGSIKISTEEGKERRKQRKALKAKQKAEKLEAKAQKLKETPAKKKSCGYKK